MLKKSRVKEILNLGVTLIKIAVMPLFGCIYNAVWDLLCCRLDELFMLIRSIYVKRMKAKNEKQVTPYS